ncbi:MAG: hypothetical protein APR53_08130 [Methanoculleus sp. SDB]|nr:MAG: hypothetical protein APR53_08130 [Methanoculleus sp. SDB]
MDISQILSGSFQDHEFYLQSITRKDRVVKDTPGLKHQKGLDILGGAVLDFCIFTRFFTPENSESKYYEKKRMKYGNIETLQKLSRDYLRLDEAVLWSTNEKNQRIWEKKGSVTLAECFKAIIGGLYRDGGIPAVERFLGKIDFYRSIDTLKSR